MKANEAPEKIYLIRNFSSPTALNTTNDHHGKFLNEWYKSREKDTDVEYTQTNAFIKKAKKWFEKQNEWFDPNGNRHCDMESFEDFKNYMKGE